MAKRINKDWIQQYCNTNIERLRNELMEYAGKNDTDSIAKVFELRGRLEQLRDILFCIA